MPCSAKVVASGRTRWCHRVGHGVARHGATRIQAPILMTPPSVSTGPTGEMRHPSALVPESLLRLHEFGLSDLAACETLPQDLKSIHAIWARGRSAKIG